jgi:hypothetical protein
MIGGAGEHVAQIGFRIHGIEPGGADQRVDCGGTLSALVGPGKQIVLAVMEIFA